MSEPVSALGGAVFDGFVKVEEAGLQGMITLRGDLASAAVKRAVRAVAGTGVPDRREVLLKGDRGAAWMSPDELLLLGPYGHAEAGVAAAGKALGKAHALAVNVSDARAVFRLTGPGAREVLAKLAPVDMAGFAPGEIRRTRLAQVPVAFWISGPEEFTVVAFRSVATYVFDLLKTAATPGGEVGVF